MIVAAIDIGTNTVLLLIAELRGAELVPLVDWARITRLGEHVDRTRQLSTEAVTRTLACLDEYGTALRAYGAVRVAAVGTSALRDAQGGAAFLDQAAERLGIRPRVIDGLVEAELTFRGALSGLSISGSVSVFDVGGGSTEVISGQSSAEAGEPQIVLARSLDVGSVRLHERHVRSDPPAAAELEAVRAELGVALAGVPPLVPFAPLVGVAGTVTTLAAIELGLAAYDPARVHGHRLTLESVERVLRMLRGMTLRERRALAGLEPKRADVIVVGAEIVRAVLAWSGAEELRVSDRGVRWGLAQQLASELQTPD